MQLMLTADLSTSLELVVALPLSVLSLCHPLVLCCRLPSPSPWPRPSPAAVELCANAALPPPPQPPPSCRRHCTVTLPPPLPSCRQRHAVALQPRPAGCRIASLCPLVVPPSCHAPLIAIALALAPSIACCRHTVRRRCTATAATAATKLPPPSHCCAAATPADSTAAAAAKLPPSCRRCHTVALPPSLCAPPLYCRRRYAAAKC